MVRHNWQSESTKQFRINSLQIRILVLLSIAVFLGLISTCPNTTCHAEHTEDSQAEQIVTSAPTLSISQEADGLTVKVDGQLFTRYLIKSGTRPVLWPVIGPTGDPLTRSYPVSKAEPGEATDHRHHRSIWVGYEGLNGVDFWHEPQADHQRTFELGQTIHRQFLKKTCQDNMAVIISQNDWIDSQQKRVCEDVRTIYLGANARQRWIDYQVVLKATDGPLQIGDSKEGFLAIRIASTMRVDANRGGKIISSQGVSNEKAWGKGACWVDYQGPVGDNLEGGNTLEGNTVGIAILSHPSSYRHPTRFHVRTYGLFAANPFGTLAFEKNPPEVTDRPLTTTIPSGGTLTLRYRIIFHRGDEKQARIAEQYAEYAAE